MEVVTAKSTRRSTRVRVEIPMTVISLDRTRPFAEKCVAVIVSAQGCGFRSSRALQIETPVLLSDLPDGGSVTGRVASCLPLGNDDKEFLVGAALYTQGNVWGIADPPQDWGLAATPPAGVEASSEQPASPKQTVAKKSWPYNLSSAKSMPRRIKG